MMGLSNPKKESRSFLPRSNAWLFGCLSDAVMGIDNILRSWEATSPFCLGIHVVRGLANIAGRHLKEEIMGKEELDHVLFGRKCPFQQTDRAWDFMEC